MEDKEFELNQKDRLALLVRRLADKKKGVILILEGSGIPGIQSLVAKLATILDPRHFRLYHMPEDMQKKANLPFLYEYWKILPQMEDVIIIDRSYYYKLAKGIIKDKYNKKEILRYERQIADFETTLSDNGYLIYKLYFSMPEKVIQKYFRKEKKSEWVTPKFLKNRYKTRIRSFKGFTKIFEKLMEPSKIKDRIHIPWKIISSKKKKDMRGRAITHLIDALEKDLNIDSINEVREFDKAMDHVRSLKKEVV